MQRLRRWLFFLRSVVQSIYLGAHGLLFEEQALTLNISMSTNYLETIHMMVSIGLGWSVLPETMLDDSVVRLNVDTALSVRRLGVVTHPGRSRSNAAGAFLDILNSGG